MLQETPSRLLHQSLQFPECQRSVLRLRVQVGRIRYRHQVPR